MLIATLIAADRLRPADIAMARDALAGVGGIPGAAEWIDEGVAADIPFQRIAGPAARAALEGLIAGIDVVVQPRAHRRKRLLVADMDSTMITIECIDELADYAGIKPQIAEITERAMQGELDFEGALDARVALLRGLDEAVIARCREERVRLMPGARALIGTMRADGAHCVLVSGGFTAFADAVAAEIGFHQAIANHLDIEDGRLAGTVGRPIVGADTKRATLLRETARLGIDPALTLAVGDGANDIAMIQAAGLGIAYRAKPRTAAAADARIEAGDLHALLYAQAYRRSDWVSE